MRIVVTGGNGFIGSHFVAAAVDKGHRVTVAGLGETPRFPHGRPFEFLPGGVLGLAAAPAVLSAADIVCHFASSTTPATSNADPAADIEANLVGTVQLLEAMRRTGNRRILYLSSGGAVYGRPLATPISEDHPLNPMSSYGVGKMAAEKYLRMYKELYDFSPIVIRPSNPYGPGQETVGQLGVVTTFIHLALSGNPATFWGDGSIVRDFISISDLTALVLAAAESKITGTYNCGAGVGTSLIELAAIVERASGKSLARVVQPARPFDPPSIVLDIRKAERTFGWSPKVELEDGILTLVETRSR